MIKKNKLKLEKIKFSQTITSVNSNLNQTTETLTLENGLNRLPKLSKTNNN